MRLSHGDVVVVPFPYTDLSSSKQRPALVLSSAAYNATNRDVILCAMTSNLQDTSHSVLVTGRDMAKGRLRADSRAKADKVVTVQASVVRKAVGTVKPAILAQVYKELLAVLPAEARAV